MLTGAGNETNMSINFDITQMPPFHDVSINQTTLINGNGRSPGKGSAGGSIASGGRTMKDYEDQLGALQKENFQLKLRVYFLEERMGISSLGGTDEDPMKKNIELKVEVEALKKEVIEKQELLSQAAKAFELQEEQKLTWSRNEADFKSLLEKERQRIAQLEKDLNEYKEKLEDPSMYFKEVFGISEDSVLETREELSQMKELVESLEVEVKQLSESLEEERSWAQDLEMERDELKQRLEGEMKAREKLAADRDSESCVLRERVKELEENLFKEKTLNQQNQKRILELEQTLKEKIVQLDEKCRVCEELNSVVEERKKRIDQLRCSVKTRDDALADVNSKYRALLNQVDGSFRRISPPSSPSTLEDSKGDSRIGMLTSPTRISSPFDWEPKSPSAFDGRDLQKKLEEKETELKSEEEAKKQLILKLCNLQQSAEQTESELKQLKAEHTKALKMIQEFLSRQTKLEEKQMIKDKKIAELQMELMKTGQSQPSKTTAVQFDEKTDGNQERFEEMEEKLSVLRAEMEELREEKANLEAEMKTEKQVEDLQKELKLKDETIETLESEKENQRLELESLQTKLSASESSDLIIAQKTSELNVLSSTLDSKNSELDSMKQKVESLSRELQMKTQSLQKLVNTELWNKNKEIAKLHNNQEKTQDCQNQLDNLMKTLSDVGIRVKFEEKRICLSYMEKGEIKDMQSLLTEIRGSSRNLVESDSETFSEPDRNVSFARMGLQEPRSVHQRSRYAKNFSDSEDSLNYVPFHKTYHDLNEIQSGSGLDRAEIVVRLNEENENLRKRLENLEEEHLNLKKDLDRLTLNHSQVLVENTKLTNEKLRLEKELRKTEGRFEANFRSIRQKFSKQIAELEAVNKDIENSDSAPSSSGVSSVPTEIHLKHDDVMSDFNHFSVNSSHFWVNYPASGRSKSSCSPDLGIESDAAISSIRPLKSTLKITESMNNLLSDEDKSTNDRDSPLHLQGLDEVESLKQENEALKRRLVKTRRALEDTFHHLTTSNKNKKNVEKAITKQLQITKNILKKTRNYDEQIFQN